MMRDLHAAIRNQPPAVLPYDWEPLHMTGAVQPYGVLLVADPASRQVQVASENSADLLGIAAADIIDRSYLALCDQERERRAIKDAVAPDTILFPNPMRMTIKGKPFDAIFHSHNGVHLIELEPVQGDDAAYADMAGNAVTELHDPGSVEELYQRAVRVVREVTGFDRVMLYRFDPRHNGQVLAESVREGVGSFLGLFFPASDLGARVRDLYLRNFTRYIPDIGAIASPLVALAADGGARVDMTHTNLRSVIPCHTEYLKNMGVQASMSFSINVDNRLWGLFACHHYQPRRVTYDQRVVCEQTAMMFIYKLGSLTGTAARMAQRGQAVAQIGRTLAVGAALARRIAALDGAWAQAGEQAAARPMLDRALAAIYAETSWLLPTDGTPPREHEGTLTDQQRLLLDVVEADSAAVVRHGHVYRIGDAPPAMAIYAIASMFGRELPDLGHDNLPVFATDHLCGVAPVTEAIKDRAAGVMAVSLSDSSPAYLMWFRREQVVQATWAGNPSVELLSAGANGQNPRASFAAWKADIRNLSRSWVLEDVQVAHDIMALIRGTEGPKLRETQAAAAFAPAWVPPPHTQAATQAPPMPSMLSTLQQAAMPAQAHAPRRVIRVGQF